MRYRNNGNCNWDGPLNKPKLANFFAAPAKWDPLLNCWKFILVLWWSRLIKMHSFLNFQAIKTVFYGDWFILENSEKSAILRCAQKVSRCIFLFAVFSIVNQNLKSLLQCYCKILSRDLGAHIVIQLKLPLHVWNFLSFPRPYWMFNTFSQLCMLLHLLRKWRKISPSFEHFSASIFYEKVLKTWGGKKCFSKVDF